MFHVLCSMRLEDFDYKLPKNLIAQEPIKPRDHSRLLVLGRKTGQTEHKYFYNIIDYLREGDVLVLNNSKVFPARLIGKKEKTGGKIEVFLHKKIRGSLWQCLLGGHGRKEGLGVKFAHGLSCWVVKDNQDGTWEVKFNQGGKEFMKIVEKIGKTPLPPYIKRKRDCRVVADAPPRNDKMDYQTVYADSKKVGSVAAPTAGFHFTPRLIKRLKSKGVRFEYITLHVGLGTFFPVKTDNIKKHKMHAEYVEVKKSVLARIKQAKKEKRRVIAVGTTSMRALEAIWNRPARHCRALDRSPWRHFVQAGGESGIWKRGFKDWVDIFIYPGYKFKIVDAMITNFHLPKSTLLILIMAFACAEQSQSAGRENIFRVYQSAIRKKYRFYSYGDAMFIY